MDNNKTQSVVISPQKSKPKSSSLEAADGGASKVESAVEKPAQVPKIQALMRREARAKEALESTSSVSPGGLGAQEQGQPSHVPEVYQSWTQPGGALVSGRLRKHSAPLANLLPKLGDVSDLQSHKKEIARRLQLLGSDYRGQSDRGLRREEFMLQQLLDWLGEEGSSMENKVEDIASSIEFALSAYELGRIYYEAGYLSAAERVFAGLSSLEGNQTASLIGQGLIKTEGGFYEEASKCFRDSLTKKLFPLQARLGLCFCFLAVGDSRRAKSLIDQIGVEHQGELSMNPAAKRIWESLLLLPSG